MPLTFKDLTIGERFRFVPGANASVISRVYTKLDDFTFRAEVDGTIGRVGVGDNPVERNPHEWQFYANGTFCTRCGAAIGSRAECR